MHLAMTMEAPITGVALMSYGLAMALLCPELKDGGLSGWAVEEEVLSEYGGKEAKQLGALGSM